MRTSGQTVGMTESTKLVTGQPEYGSVEHYAETIRDGVNGGSVSAYALGVIDSIANSDRGADADRVTQIRNVLTAARQVMGEPR